MRKTIARIDQSFTFMLDYSVSPSGMLERSGCKYDEKMERNHPALKGTGTVEVTAHLIDMGHGWGIDEAFLAIHELGLKPAPDNAALWKISGLKEYLDIARKVWIIDPNTDWRDAVACVYGHAQYRQAYASVKRNRWDRDCQVLALSKQCDAMGVTLSPSRE